METPFFGKLVSYETGSSISCRYCGLSCKIMMSSATPKSECIWDSLRSDWRLFGVENLFMWGVTISLKRLLVLQT